MTNHAPGIIVPNDIPVITTMVIVATIEMNAVMRIFYFIILQSAAGISSAEYVGTIILYDIVLIFRGLLIN